MVLPRKRYVKYLHYCVKSIQFKFLHWRCVNRKKNATCIQRYRRGYTKRHAFRSFYWSLLCLQVTFRYNRNKKRTSASTIIQSWNRQCVAQHMYSQTIYAFQTFGVLIKWFLWRARRIHNRHQAALRLQDMTRYIRIRMKYVRIKRTIIRTQQIYRHHLVRKQKATVIESFGRMVLARMHWLKCSPAAVHIQTLGRGFVMRERFCTQVVSAVVIQSWVRSWRMYAIFTSVLKQRRRWKWCLDTNEAVVYVNQHVVSVSKRKKKTPRTILVTSRNRILLLSTPMQKRKSDWVVDDAIEQPMYKLQDQDDILQICIASKKGAAGREGSKWTIESLDDLQGHDVFRNMYETIESLEAIGKTDWKRAWFCKVGKEVESF